MAERTILTWNITNWITVVLMAATAFAVLGVAGSFLRKAKGGNQGVSSDNV